MKLSTMAVQSLNPPVAALTDFTNMRLWNAENFSKRKGMKVDLFFWAISFAEVLLGESGLEFKEFDEYGPRLRAYGDEHAHEAPIVALLVDILNVHVPEDERPHKAAMALEYDCWMVLYK